MSEQRRPLIALLTDFGMRDAYIAEMKAVILAILPQVQFLDITHEIPPGDVAAGAYVLGRIVSRLPAGTVCLAVVDPGVGSQRQAVIVVNRGLVFAAPDNGLLARALDWTAPLTVRVLNAETAHPTFNGRDLFAPAAAKIAGGVPISEMSASGRLVDTIPPSPPTLTADGIRGEVIYIDRFGNAATNIPNREGGRLEVGDVTLRHAKTYSDAKPGEIIFLNGSDGCFEIAANGAPAGALLSITAGTQVLWRA